MQVAAVVVATVVADLVAIESGGAEACAAAPFVQLDAAVRVNAIGVGVGLSPKFVAVVVRAFRARVVVFLVVVVLVLVQVVVCVVVSLSAVVVTVRCGSPLAEVDRSSPQEWTELPTSVGRVRGLHLRGSASDRTTPLPRMLVEANAAN